MLYCTRVTVRRIIEWVRVLGVRVLAVLVLIGGVQYVFNVDSRAQAVNLEDELSRLVELNEELAAENERLRLQIQGIQHDDRYLEQIARHEFGMIRKGEVLYKFVE